MYVIVASDMENNREALREFVASYDRQYLAATALGISPQYLNNLLNSRRALPKSMLMNRLWRRVARWMRQKETA